MTTTADPHTIDLSNGSYLKWDNQDGIWRVAVYERRSAKSFELANALSIALKKPIYHKDVKEIEKYIATTST